MRQGNKVQDELEFTIYIHETIKELKKINKYKKDKIFNINKWNLNMNNYY